MKAKVLRYTEDLQKALDSKIKSEPWLHCVILEDKPLRRNMYGSMYYAIYVWDTREILESSMAFGHKLSKVAEQPAKDNHQTLKGKFFASGKHLLDELYAKWANDAAKDDDSIELTIPENIRGLQKVAAENPGLSRYFVICNYWHQYAEGITGCNRDSTLYLGAGGQGWNSKDIKNVMKACQAYAKANNRTGKNQGYGPVGGVNYKFVQVSLAEIAHGTAKIASMPGAGSMNVKKANPIKF